MSGVAQGKVAALVVTYDPDEGFRQRLELLAGQVGRIVVVDNGSPSPPDVAGMPGVTLLRNATNQGIAAALNQGMGQLAAEGVDWVLTLDQDSTLEEGFVRAQLDALAKDPAPETVALVGALRTDEGADGIESLWLRPGRWGLAFQRVRCKHLDERGTTLVITSGTLTSVRIYRQLGPFPEAFFMDCVDFDYCLRARRQGYRIIASCGSLLRHRLGTRRKVRLLGRTLHLVIHSPVRRYYRLRNTVVLMRRYGARFPHWFLYETMATGALLLGIVLFEPDRLRQLRASALGVWDGLLNRLGPCRRVL